MEANPGFESIRSRIRACEAVVFDLDDTLYLERDYVRGGVRAVACWTAAQIGADPDKVQRELVAWVARGATRDPFGRWLRGRGLDPQLWLPRMLDVYRSHRPAIKLDAGVERLLDRLAAKRKLGLVTDGRVEQQRLKVEALGLDRWPISVVYSDALGRENWKPSPLAYLRALELTGVPAHRAVYVGDNPAKDFLGARRAGMLSIRFRRRGGLHAHMQPTGAKHASNWETSSLRELRRALGG